MASYISVRYFGQQRIPLSFIDVHSLICIKKKKKQRMLWKSHLFAVDAIHVKVLMGNTNVKEKVFLGAC